MICTTEMEADAAWILVQLGQRFGVPMTVVPGKLTWFGEPFHFRRVRKQYGLSRFLVPFVEMGNRITKILKREHVNIWQSGFNDFKRDGGIGFVRVPQDQVVLIITTDGIMSSFVISLGQC